MKLIHITDTHLVSPGDRLYGLDPRQRLDAAVSDIVRHHSDAALTVVTGDLTHWGEPEAYVAFDQCVSRLPMPVVCLLGNHDVRRHALDLLPQVPQDGNGFAQGFRDTPTGRLVFLDTLDETSHAGKICAQRFAWLANALETAPADTRFLIFMHHPPFLVGVHAMDEIALAERQRFVQIVGPYRQRIRHLFFGHVHRPISGSWQGIPFSTLRGTNHQVWFTLDSKSPHLTSHEPPAYAVVLVGADQIVVHVHDYLDTSLKTPFAAPAGVDDRAYALGPFTSVAQ